MKWFRVLGLLLALAVYQRAQAQTTTVTWGITHQTMDGFGVWDAFQGSAMTSANADTLFSTTSGAGLSLLATLVPSGAPDSTGTCFTVNSGCAGTNTGDMALAVARGARIFSAPWTPPASYKSNNSYSNGGYLCIANGNPAGCTAGHYADYATYLTNYVKSVQTYVGITPYAVSVQEEPDQNVPYDSAIWSAQNIHDFVLNNLGPSFSSAGLTTRIMMPQPSCANLLHGLADTTMNDSAAAAYVGIVAGEDFCNNQISYTVGHAGTTGTPDWMVATGNLGSGPFDPSIAGGLEFAKQIHNNTTLGWSAWVYWIWHSSNANQQLIDIATGTVSKTLWVMGQWSKFVRPGWVRIDTTENPQTGVYVTAFKSPDGGSYSIVAVNTNNSATSQTFTFSGFPSTTSITPWVTSSTLDLAGTAIGGG